MVDPNIVNIIQQYGNQGNESSFDTSDQSSDQFSDHTVLVNIKLSNYKFLRPNYFKLEDRLEQNIIKYDVGELDGNEIGGGYWRIYMYGPDADKLFQAIEPIIKKAKLPGGSYVTKIYGELGTHEDRIYI